MSLYKFPRCQSITSMGSAEFNAMQTAEAAPKPEAKPKPKPKPKFKTLLEKQKKPKVKMHNAGHMAAWREHRERVLGMTSELDTRPPGFQAIRVTGVITLRQIAMQFMERTRKNIQMLVELSKTMRTHGDIMPFRYDRVYTMSSLPYTLKQLDRLDVENRDIGKRIKDVVSGLDTGIEKKNSLVKRKHKARIPPFHMPQTGLAKYKGYNITMPKTDKERWNLLRPTIYLDIFLKGSRPLGRIVVQLYTEAAPVVVLQMVRACICNMHQKIVIKRLFPNLWMDVDLLEHGNSDLNQSLEYDGKIIDHGASAYVLSFSKEYLQGFPKNVSFSMSFKPLSVANGSRIGFGQIIQGSKILDSLQCYGTKNGKLNRSIVFTSCGLL
ncbi:uncharacterized protein Dmoj_GI25810 [Drosophila mojavensis]|uniref:PPIase cyclophilin-type domain-containing protein n=1 Tax=Drosophila mojavensis TaxID=7230 RepID=A0A0Q9XK94_DROMO|nr:uncharacterized protein Dmoj_GI25810 [Drosophila mojavensis]